MDFALTDAQQQIRDEVLRLCAQFDDRYWLERDATATFPSDFFNAMAAGGWLGIAMPEAYGGSGLGITEADDHGAGGRRIGRRNERRQRDPHQHLRPEPRRGLRHRCPEGAHAAAFDRGQGQVLLRRDGTERRPEHDGDHHARRSARRSLPDQRDEDLDVHGAGGEQDPAAGAHHAAGQGQAQDPRHDAVLHRPRQGACRGASDPQDGPSRRRFEHGLLRGHARCRSKTGSARKARVSAPCCMV